MKNGIFEIGDMVRSKANTVWMGPMKIDELFDRRSSRGQIYGVQHPEHGSGGFHHCDLELVSSPAPTLKIGDKLRIKMGIPGYHDWCGAIVTVVKESIPYNERGLVTVERANGLRGGVFTDELELIPEPAPAEAPFRIDDKTRKPIPTPAEARAAWIAKVTTLNEYGAAAMRTKAPHNDLTCAALGLSGESAEAVRAVVAMSVSAGQFADLTKKHVHHKHPLEKEKAIKELGDVLWYFALACDVLGVTPEEVAQMNLTKLADRYPEGFTVEASKHG